VRACVRVLCACVVCMHVCVCVLIIDSSFQLIVSKSPCSMMQFTLVR